MLSWLEAIFKCEWRGGFLSEWLVNGKACGIMPAFTILKFVSLYQVSVQCKSYIYIQKKALGSVGVDRAPKLEALYKA